MKTLMIGGWSNGAKRTKILLLDVLAYQEWGSQNQKQSQEPNSEITRKPDSQYERIRSNERAA